MLHIKAINEVELAARWNVPRTRLQRWRNKGFGPRYLRVGTLIRYPLEEVEKFEHEELQQSTAENRKRPNNGGAVV